MADHRMKPDRCPHCGALVDAAGSAPGDKDEGGPEQGSISICLYCARPSIFDSDLRLHRPTPAQIDEILADPDVRRAIKAVKIAGPRKPGGYRGSE